MGFGASHLNEAAREGRILGWARRWLVRSVGYIRNPLGRVLSRQQANSQGREAELAKIAALAALGA